MRLAVLSERKLPVVGWGKQRKLGKLRKVYGRPCPEGEIKPLILDFVAATLLLLKERRDLDGLNVYCTLEMHCTFKETVLLSKRERTNSQLQANCVISLSSVV